MSEIPEKKVLKEVLKKLKARTINSEKELIDSFTNLYSQIAEVWKTLSDTLEEEISGKEIAKLLGFDVRGVHLGIEMLLSCSRRTLEDFKMYTGSLEQYSSELDKTLNDIFEQAEKMAEEQQKQLEELKKKEPTYRA